MVVRLLLLLLPKEFPAIELWIAVALETSLTLMSY